PKSAKLPLQLAPLVWPGLNSQQTMPSRNPFEHFVTWGWVAWGSSFQALNDAEETHNRCSRESAMILPTNCFWLCSVSLPLKILHRDLSESSSS
ncbi:MAG TPA: hypothetical protein V6C72_10595, partial [Chroococcales cyanobacterium]